MNKKTISLVALLLATLLLASCTVVATAPEEFFASADISTLITDELKGDLSKLSLQIEFLTKVDHAIPFNVQIYRTFIRGYGVASKTPFPVVTVISSTAELKSYDDQYDLSYNKSIPYDGQGVYDKEWEEVSWFGKYDDSFFEHSSLVLVFLQESSGSFRHEVVNISGDGIINANRIRPAGITDDVGWWTMVFEVDKQYKNIPFSIQLEDVFL